MDAPADAVLRLEDQRVVPARVQLEGGDQAGDAGAEDEDSLRPIRLRRRLHCRIQTRAGAGIAAAVARSESAKGIVPSAQMAASTNAAW